MPATSASGFPVRKHAAVILLPFGTSAVQISCSCQLQHNAFHCACQTGRTQHTAGWHLGTHVTVSEPHTLLPQLKQSIPFSTCAAYLLLVDGCSTMRPHAARRHERINLSTTKRPSLQFITTPHCTTPAAPLVLLVLPHPPHDHSAPFQTALSDMPCSLDSPWLHSPWKSPRPLLQSSTGAQPTPLPQL